jgi:glycosyltransferase involved in cell wall biosynthesis
MTRICLIGADNYLMLNPAENALPVNGEAVQQVLLARAFKSLGLEVTTVVNAIHDDIDETIDGIRVISAFRRRAGLPYFRLFYPRMTGLFRALSRVNADVYIESPAGILTGLAAAYCRKNDRKFIFRAASDVDCIPGRQLINLWRDRKIYEYGLRRANVIAVQSQRQKNLLKQHYGLDSWIVNMALEEPQEDIECERDIDVLWVSNLKQVKRPDRLIELARKLPDIEFTMIGGVVDEEQDLYAITKRDAESLPNLNFLGQVPYDDVNKYIARAKVFVNTSDVEGFPNTFLQAWARATPVISFFDPDDILEGRGLGQSPADEAEMSRVISSLVKDEERRSTIGSTARQFALAEYSATAAAKRYIELSGL